MDQNVCDLEGEGTELDRGEGDQQPPLGGSGAQAAHQSCPSLGWKAWAFVSLPLSVVRGLPRKEGHAL